MFRQGDMQVLGEVQEAVGEVQEVVGGVQTAVGGGQKAVERCRRWLEGRRSSSCPSTFAYSKAKHPLSMHV